MKEEAEEWRGKLIEAVADVDDTLLERYLEDHESITGDEVIVALRKSTIDGLAIPVICGAAFKNKGVQSLLDSVIAFLPSPVDKGSVTELIREMMKRLHGSLMMKNQWLLLHLK